MARTNKKGGNTAGLKGWSGFTNTERKIDSTSKPDGRADSSAFQKNSWWDKVKSKAKSVGETIKENIPKAPRSAHVGLSNKELADRRARDLKEQQGRDKVTKMRKDQASVEKEKASYRKAYDKDPIAKQRDNESDKQYARRRADKKRHQDMYADKKYKERLAADKQTQDKKSLAMTPKTKKESKKKRKDFVTST
tara:strand:+ start:1740 stop:2321 length:582 start_codon:yes stop_codon:yes gene_type:complete